ncbi:pathogenicity island protein [Staphylococcus epidermidis]|uniref:pathogenicity island protein n=1 Tax=Staphylococcus epidermidis TaxID=1282 RepID=UPI001D0D112C|nr:pathogenicity island protein [Staphylococcus epidermidis]
MAKSAPIKDHFMNNNVKLFNSTQNDICNVCESTTTCAKNNHCSKKINIKKVGYCLYYRENKITEYELLTAYNPHFINTKVKGIRLQIEAMYYLNISHSTASDVLGFVTVSYPLEKLVMHILDEKAKLNRYIKRSSKKLALFKEVVKEYTPSEQKEIMYYVRSNGVAVDSELINRLRCDLYKAIHSHKVGVKA